MTRHRIGPRCAIEVHLDAADLARELRQDTLDGLTARDKHLPPKWFYDARGSDLFDRITRLAEYYPTQRETEILEREATTIALRTGAETLLELGSGTSTKTRLLLDGLAAAGTLRRIVPFDVCEQVLRSAVPELAARYPATSIDAVVGDFERHLGRLPMGGTTLVAFLGGTIGNFTPSGRAKLLGELSDQLAPGDWLLLGTDLVKDPQRLVRAYDDASGITAEFNRNVLHVLNRELDGDLAPERFAHVALWDPDQEWIEMHLRSEGDQRASLRELGLDLRFRDGEGIHTEISAKFTPGRIESELAAADLEMTTLLTDSAGDFAVSLSRKA